MGTHASELIIAPEVYIGLHKLKCDAIVVSSDGSIAPKREEVGIVIGQNENNQSGSGNKRVFEVLDIENDGDGSNKRKRTVDITSDSPIAKQTKMVHPSGARPATGNSRHEAICLD